MEKLGRVLLLSVKIVGVCVSIIVISTISYCSYTKNPASDKWFRENYYSKKMEFEELKKMVCGIPNIKYVQSNGTYNIEAKFNTEIITKIVELMENIGTKSVQVTEGCSISVSIWDIGFAGSGVNKDYAFNVDPSDRKLVQSTDEINVRRGEIKEPTFYTLKLDNGWSVSYDIWP
jgi:hypothetical protein